MLKSIRYILFSSAVLFATFSNAQINKSKAIPRNLASLRSIAQQEFQAGEHENAIKVYDAYLSKIKFTDTSALFNLAESYRFTRRYDSAIKIFNQLASIDPKYFLNLAALYAIKGEYDKSIDAYQQVKNADSSLVKIIESHLNGIKAREDFQLDSLDWRLINSRINSDADETNLVPYDNGILYKVKDNSNSTRSLVTTGSSVLFAHDSLMLRERIAKTDSVVSRKTVPKTKKTIFSDLTERNSVDNNTLIRTFQKRQQPTAQSITAVDPFIKELINRGPISFTKTKDTIFYSKPVKISSRQNKLGIFYAIKLQGRWIEKEEITRGFSGFAFHPTSTPDGRKIFFSADFAEGFGGPDLYYIERIGDSAWSEAVNMGNVVNTGAAELYPTLIGDTLFFSSNGRGGLGGQDIYSLKLGSNQAPVNVGYPINSSFDDFNFLFNEQRTGGYVSTNRFGSNDILAFKFDKVYYRAGGIVINDSGSTLKQKSQLYLVDTKTQTIVDSTEADESGNYFFNLRPNRIYRVEQRQHGVAERTYWVNTKEPVLKDSSILSLKNQKNIVPDVVLGKSEAGKLDSTQVQSVSTRDLIFIDRSIDSIKHFIVTLESISNTVSNTGFIDSLINKRPIINKSSIETDVNALKQILVRLEDTKSELLTFLNDSSNNVISINSKRPFRNIDYSFNNSATVLKEKIQRIESQIEVVQNNVVAYDEMYVRGDLQKQFNVYFGFSKFNLDFIEQKILDSAVKVLKNNPNLFVVMGSFTDCSGPFNFNLKLSAKRSATVKKYFIQHGINSTRIIENNYGKNYLVQNCDEKRYNKSQQLLNRRTEIYLSTAGSLTWKDIASDTSKKYSVYTALSNKLNDFVTLNAVKVKGKDFVQPQRKEVRLISNQSVLAKTAKVTTSGARSTDIVNKKDTLAVAKSKSEVVKKDTLAIAKAKSNLVKKDTLVVAKTKPDVVKKDTLVVSKTKPDVVKKDTLVVAKPKSDVVKKDTLVVAKSKSELVKKDTLAIAKSKSEQVKKDTLAVAKSKSDLVKKDTLAVAKSKSDVVKKDTLAVAKSKSDVVKKDTLAIAKAKSEVIKKDTVVVAKSTSELVKKDTLAIAKTKPDVVKKDTLVVAKTKPDVVKKDSLVVDKPKTDVVKKDTLVVAKPKSELVKKDSLVVAKPKPGVVKKDTLVVAKPKSEVVKKDTLAVAKTSPNLVKKDTLATAKTKSISIKKDTLTIAKTSPSLVKKDTLGAAKSLSNVVKEDKGSTVKSASVGNKSSALSEDEEERISRAELLAALDSLAKLKREQERIVEYLTKRINKKPIEVFTTADSVTVEIFDSGIHDKDSVSVIYNRRLIVDKHELKVDKPIKFKLRVDKERKNNEMVIVAENLGFDPPNTAVMIITDKFGKHEEIILNTDLSTNEVVVFIRIDKK